MNDPSATLGALADPNRRKILDLLSEGGPQTVSTLAESFDISRQAVSKHVAQLEQSGLVSRATQGRAVLFSVERSALRDTSVWLERTTRRWERRLDRLTGMLGDEVQPPVQFSNADAAPTSE